MTTTAALGRCREGFLSLALAQMVGACACSRRFRIVVIATTATVTTVTIATVTTATVGAEAAVAGLEIAGPGRVRPVVARC